MKGLYEQLGDNKFTVTVLTLIKTLSRFHNSLINRWEEMIT